jgi:hypothetical protein
MLDDAGAKRLSGEMEQHERFAGPDERFSEKVPF